MTCKIPGCALEIDNGKIMCAKHWAKVPGGIQRDVYAARARWTREGADPVPTFKAYSDAINAAVNLVVEMEKLK